MDRLYDLAKKNIREIEEVGLNMSNVEFAGELVDIIKDINEINEKEGQGMAYGMPYRGYDDNYGRRGMYRDNGGYNGNYSGGYRDYPEYGRRGGGSYGHDGGRLVEYLNRIMDAYDMYDFGKERYHSGDDSGRMHDGLEKLMYALCSFVESAMEFAETPEEKEVIRKHIQKMKNL